MLRLGATLVYSPVTDQEGDVLSDKESGKDTGTSPAAAVSTTIILLFVIVVLVVLIFLFRLVHVFGPQ